MSHTYTFNSIRIKSTNIDRENAFLYSQLMKHKEVHPYFLNVVWSSVSSNLQIVSLFNCVGRQFNPNTSLVKQKHVILFSLFFPWRLCFGAFQRFFSPYSHINQNLYNYTDGRFWQNTYMYILMIKVYMPLFKANYSQFLNALAYLNSMINKKIIIKDW